MIDAGCLKAEVGPPKVYFSSAGKSVTLSTKLSPFIEAVACD
jgi:hypothetical protein